MERGKTVSLEKKNTLQKCMQDKPAAKAEGTGVLRAGNAGCPEEKVTQSQRLQVDQEMEPQMPAVINQFESGSNQQGVHASRWE